MIKGRVVIKGQDLARLREHLDPVRIRRGILTALFWAMNDARDHARDTGMGGGPGRLRSRRGEAGLRGAIITEVEAAGDIVRGFLGVGGLVYAAIHEFGGQTKPHIIRPKRGKALAFLGAGGPVVAKQVRHPGSKIPARPYLRPGLQHGLEQLCSVHWPAVLEGQVWS